MKNKKYVIIISLLLFFILILSKNTYSNTEIDVPKEKVKITVSYDMLNKKRNEISKKYNINIKILSEANYSYYGIAAVKIADYNECYDMLNEIESGLKKYPIELFKELETGYAKIDLRPTIYLVKYISDELYAITDKQYADNVKLVIADEENVEATFHHEMMHVLEHYIMFKYYPDVPFKDYKEYNPTGFSYKLNGKLEEKYENYFVSDYSVSSEMEDRATIFETLMYHSVENRKLINSKAGVKIKAEYISVMLAKYFPNIIFPEKEYYWLEFLK